MKSTIHILTDKTNANLKTPLESDTFAFYKNMQAKIVDIFIIMHHMHNLQKEEFVELYESCNEIILNDKGS